MDSESRQPFSVLHAERLIGTTEKRRNGAYSALESRRSKALTASRAATPSNSTAQTAWVIGMSIA